MLPVCVVNGAGWLTPVCGLCVCNVAGLHFYVLPCLVLIIRSLIIRAYCYGWSIALRPCDICIAVACIGGMACAYIVACVIVMIWHYICDATVGLALCEGLTQVCRVSPCAKAQVCVAALKLTLDTV